MSRRGQRSALPDVIRRPVCRKDRSFRVQCGRRQSGIKIAINFSGKVAPAELSMLGRVAPQDDNLDPDGIAVGEFQPE
jgi:hypothetical protein